MEAIKRPPIRVMQLVLSLVIGGTEKLVHDMVRYADPRRVSPAICCLDDLGEFGQALSESGYPIDALHRQPGIDWPLVRQISHILQQKKIDVIHAHHYTPYFYGVMAMLRCKMIGAENVPKIVFTEHGIHYPYRKKVKRLLINPVLCRLADELVTIAEHTKSNLVKYENYPRKKTRIIYNGIELSAFSKSIDIPAKKKSLGIPPDGKVVGMVARLDPVKNHVMLLRAFQSAAARLPDSCLMIVGDGPMRAELEALSAELGISEKVFFLGARQDIPDLLKTMDIFVLSSFSEGMSITLLEAMAAGLPVIATNVGGNPEVVADGESGYLVSNDDAKGLSQRLLSLLKDEKTRGEMGRAGRQRAERHFSLQHTVNRYTRLYFKVCGLSPNWKG